MISGRVLVTALLPPIRHYAFRFWLTQTFAQIAGNVLSPSSPVRRFDERVLVQPHTCARRCNERVCKCVCHDYTRSSSVCNRSPFAGRSKERRGAHVERDPNVNFVPDGIKTGTRDLLSRFLASII